LLWLREITVMVSATAEAQFVPERVDVEWGPRSCA